MSSIGGYFELELRGGSEYHPGAIGVNSGRNAFEYILLCNSYSKVYMPRYTCEAAIEPLKRNNIPFEFYNIDERLQALFAFENIKENEAFLYTNYFGLMDEYIHQLASSCRNLIIDNSQSFYSLPLKGVDTFYSPRKFFGVPDGGYAYSQRQPRFKMARDSSWKRFDHLLRRIDAGAEDGYGDFAANESLLNDLPLLAMSKLTQRLLQSVDYEAAADKRRSNFGYLHNALQLGNSFAPAWNGKQVPLAYPYLANDTGLRGRLSGNRIYTATYWPNVLGETEIGSVEHRFAKNFIFLPIDQRYGAAELDLVIDMINTK